MIPPVTPPSPVPISPAEEPKTCANCGRTYPAKEMDVGGWCVRCRAQLVRRSGLLARLIAFVFTLGLAALIYSRAAGNSTFLVAYVVLVVATYFLVVRIAQRVAFEILRSRGVPPPPAP